MDQSGKDAVDDDGRWVSFFFFFLVLFNEDEVDWPMIHVRHAVRKDAAWVDSDSGDLGWGASQRHGGH